MAKRQRHTLREVADRAGVSIGTASRVLSNHPSVSPKMRDAVRKAAGDLDYEPRRRNGDGRLPENTVIGVVTRDGSGFTNPFYSYVLKGIQQAAADIGIGLMYEAVPESGANAWHRPRLLRPGTARGVVLMGYMPAIFAQQVLASGLPVVVVDHCFDDLDIDSVCNDDERGARLATKRLVDLGHTDPPPAAIAGPLEHASLRRRLAGYQSTLAESGLAYDETYVRIGNLDASSGYEQANALLDLKRPPTAVFCFNDLMAIGALNALHERGLKAPRDFAVIGYDDIDLASHTNPPLTSVTVDKQLMGMQGLWHLSERLHHPGIPHRETRLPVQIVDRESSRPRH